VGLWVSGDLPLTLNLTDLPLLKSLEGGLGLKEIDLPQLDWVMGARLERADESL